MKSLLHVFVALYPLIKSISFSSTYFVDWIDGYLLDITIHVRVINPYPLDNVIGFAVTYPMDSELSAN